MEEEDYKRMLKKGKETSYHTTEDEQRDFEAAEKGDPFLKDDKLISQIATDIQVFREELDKRAAKEGLSEIEVEKQFIRYATKRYEWGTRQLMAMYDVYKKRYFLKEGQSDSDRIIFVRAQYRLSLAIDALKQSLEDQKAALKDLEEIDS